jgi:hypothetical protein
MSEYREGEMREGVETPNNPNIPEEGKREKERERERKKKEEIINHDGNMKPDQKR